MTTTSGGTCIVRQFSYLRKTNQHEDLFTRPRRNRRHRFGTARLLWCLVVRRTRGQLRKTDLPANAAQQIVGTGATEATLHHGRSVTLLGIAVAVNSGRWVPLYDYFVLDCRCVYVFEPSIVPNDK